MQRAIEEVITCNCYLPHKPVSVFELLPKVLGRELTKEEIFEVSEFIQADKPPLPGCRRFFEDCRETKNCIMWNL